MVIAGRVFAAGRDLLQIESSIVGNEQIELPVAIVIDPGAACGEAIGGTPPGGQQAGLFGDIGERAVAVVVEQNVLAPAGNEDIVKAVVIVISNGDAGGPEGACQTRFFRRIRKSAVAVVMVQADGGPFGSIFEAAPGEDDDIEPAVVVVIEEGCTTAHGFEDVVCVVGVAIDNGGMEPGGAGDVGEAGMKGFAGRLARGSRRDFTRSHAAVLCAGKRQDGMAGDGSQRERERVPPCHEFSIKYN